MEAARPSVNGGQDGECRVCIRNNGHPSLLSIRVPQLQVRLAQMGMLCGKSSAIRMVSSSRHSPHESTTRNHSSPWGFATTIIVTWSRYIYIVCIYNLFEKNKLQIFLYLYLFIQSFLMVPTCRLFSRCWRKCHKAYHWKRSDYSHTSCVWLFNSAIHIMSYTEVCRSFISYHHLLFIYLFINQTLLRCTTIDCMEYHHPLFENVTLFHDKLGLDVCPRGDNQTSGDTLQDSTWRLVEKSPSADPPMDIGASFWWQDALPHQPVRNREETLESGNLFSGSWISASVPPPYLHIKSCFGFVWKGHLNHLNRCWYLQI